MVSLFRIVGFTRTYSDRRFCIESLVCYRMIQKNCYSIETNSFQQYSVNQPVNRIKIIT